jgi:hypothetical protein
MAMVGALEKEKGPAFLQYLKFWTMMAFFFLAERSKLTMVRKTSGQRHGTQKGETVIA